MKLDTRKVYIARAKSGKNTAELAAEYGCSISGFNALCKGGKKFMKPETLGRLARVLNVDESEILAAEGN